VKTTLAVSNSQAVTYLETAGPAMIWLIVVTFVFLECGVIVGLFLPGDSLLITAGIVLAEQTHDLQPWLLSLVTIGAAVSGNHLGYVIGERSGTRLLARKDGKVLNQHNLDRAKRFMDRYGMWAVLLARWVPWARTLAPIIAGATGMDARRYLMASVLGAVGWVPVLILIGYYSYGVLEHYPWVRHALLIGFGAFVVAGTAYGAWRYYQDIHRPVVSEENSVDPATRHQDGS
jgi:membrane-associated protein